MNNQMLDAMLAELDAEHVKAGEPILSVLVTQDDSKRRCATFWDSVQRYNLRLPNETDDALVARLQEAAFKYWEKR